MGWFKQLLNETTVQEVTSYTVEELEANFTFTGQYDEQGRPCVQRNTPEDSDAQEIANTGAAIGSAFLGLFGL